MPLSPTELGLQRQVVLNCLNDAFDRDPTGIHCLQSVMIPCNQGLVEHPTVMVWPSRVSASCYTTAIGLLNGVLGAIGLLDVEAEFQDGKMVGFREVSREHEG